MSDPIRGQTAICGLGITEMGKVYGHDASWFAGESIKLAIEDAGLEKDQIDGLLVNSGITGMMGTGIGIPLQGYLGLRNLRLLNHMNSYGATASAMIQYAAMAVNHGMANYVACIFADAPLQQGGSAGAAYGGAGRRGPSGMASLMPAFGFYGANTSYALAARRYMERYGITNNDLGRVSVTQRRYAVDNPHATMRQPLTLEDYHNSRWIVDPFHLLDCCLVSNGAVCTIVTTADRARDLQSDPAYIWGMGQGHPGNFPHAEVETGTTSGAVIAGETAYKMAGVGPDDVDICEFYDCYTYTVLRTIEDYGLAKPGEAIGLYPEDPSDPEADLPLINTGGGQLSSYYMWGMTPVSEAVIQARGSGGERQVEKNDIVLCSGNGGTLDTHGTLILSPNAN